MWCEKARGVLWELREERVIEYLGQPFDRTKCDCHACRVDTGRMSAEERQRLTFCGFLMLGSHVVISGLEQLDDPECQKASEG
jgi:hypothetical protein